MITIPVQALLAGDRIVSTPDKVDTDPMTVTSVGWQLDRIVFEYTCPGNWVGRCALRPGATVGIERRYGK